MGLEQSLIRRYVFGALLKSPLQKHTSPRGKKEYLAREQDAPTVAHPNKDQENARSIKCTTTNLSISSLHDLEVLITDN